VCSSIIRLAMAIFDLAELQEVTDAKIKQLNDDLIASIMAAFDKFTEQHHREDVERATQYRAEEEHAQFMAQWRKKWDKFSSQPINLPSDEPPITSDSSNESIVSTSMDASSLTKLILLGSGNASSILDRSDLSVASGSIPIPVLTPLTTVSELNSFGAQHTQSSEQRR
jgi:hypothetical protein